jgi:hypothetical protein
MQRSSGDLRLPRQKLPIHKKMTKKGTSSGAPSSYNAPINSFPSKSENTVNVFSLVINIETQI